MQPPRRVSVDVSAAARFALLYFFLPLEASAHTYLQRLPACVLGGRSAVRSSALICRRADPPGYQTAAQKKVRLSPPSQLAAVPARPLAGVPPPHPGTTSAGARSVYCGRAKAGGGAVLVHYQLPGASRTSTFSYGLLCVYAVRWS